MPDQFGVHCCDCPYKNQEIGRLPLTIEDNPNSTALLILESPGQTEWTEREPLRGTAQGSAGLIVTSAIERIGRQRSDFSITNAIQCLPPSKGGPDFRAAHGQCANWLRQDINRRHWHRIVVFGAPAELSVRCLGYSERTGRVCFMPYPTFKGKNSARIRAYKAALYRALRWALGQ